MLITPLIISLCFIHGISASVFMRFIDKILGFGPSEMDVLHGFNGIKSVPEFQCQVALKFKHHPNAWVIANALNPLDEIISNEKLNFRKLNEREKIDYIQFYADNIVKRNIKYELQGEPLDRLLYILCHGDAYHVIIVALRKGIFSQHGTLLFFLKRVEFFKKAVDANILSSLDTTVSLVAGKTLLHYLAEISEYSDLLISILRKSPLYVERKIKEELFTSGEGYSLMHSAVISDSPELIEYVAREFNCLCGHINVFGMSPLKLAIVTGASLPSINALLKYGCIADGEIILKKRLVQPTKRSSLRSFKPIDSLKKMLKWSSFESSSIKELTENLQTVGLCRRIVNYKFFGLLASYQSFIREMDFQLFRHITSTGLQILNSSLKSYFKFESSESSILAKLASSYFDPDSHEIGSVQLNLVLRAFQSNIYSEDLKKQVLRNLTKVKLEVLDCSLVDFMRILIRYSDADVFAFFVKHYIDYHFCIRFLFSSNYNPEQLKPFFDAISFGPRISFPDGSFPIHLAVIMDNLSMIQYLKAHYSADLNTLTKFEKNNVLHYGLNDKISFATREYLIQQVPALIIKNNIFGVAPYSLAIKRSESFDVVRRIISCANVQYKHINREQQELGSETIDLLDEVLYLWPNSNVCDVSFKGVFESVFNSCYTDELARLLLDFSVRKLIDYSIEKGKSFVKLQSNIDSAPSPHGVDQYRHSPKLESEKYQNPI